MLHFREIFRRWEMQTHKERWSIRQRSFERLRRRQTNRNFLNDGCVSTMCTHFDELCTRRAQRLRFTIVVSPQRSTHNEGVIARTCYRGENSESDESGALNFGAPSISFDRTFIETLIEWLYAYNKLLRMDQDICEREKF